MWHVKKGASHVVPLIASAKCRLTDSAARMKRNMVFMCEPALWLGICFCPGPALQNMRQRLMIDAGTMPSAIGPRGERTCTMGTRSACAHSKAQHGSVCALEGATRDVGSLRRQGCDFDCALAHLSTSASSIEDNSSVKTASASTSKYAAPAETTAVATSASTSGGGAAAKSTSRICATSACSRPWSYPTAAHRDTNGRKSLAGKSPRRTLKYEIHNSQRPWR